MAGRSAARALLVYALEGLVVPTFLTAHGLDDDAASPAVARTALAQSVALIGQVRAGDWWLLRVHDVVAGSGRVHGQISVTDRAGRPLAAAEQDGLVRAPGALPNSANS